ncbi:MAG: lysoplasmalogenase, partial [Spirochaetes bacterium]|nr:lysoplasmalogenase [Spirochaetota bacterium]
MTLYLLPAILIGGVATWFGVQQRAGVEYIKGAFPLYLSLLVMDSYWRDPNYLKGGILTGLLFCTIADFLLGRRNNTPVFLFGLVGFLLAYLTYGVTFFLSTGISAIWGILAGILFILGILQYRTFRTLPNALRVPVLLYLGVVSFFFVSATSFAYIHSTFFPFLGALGIYGSD